MLGKPMFPGVSTLNQIERVLKVTGMPTQEDIDAMVSPHCTKIFATIPPTKKVSLESVFPAAPEDAIDLMKKLLKFNPKDRLTVEEALEHSYVSQFHNIDNEPVCKKIITIPIDDNKKFSIKEYRLKIYTDIHKRKKDLRKKKMMQEQLYYQKKKSAMGYSTQYGSSGYAKQKEPSTGEPSRPGTTHTRGHGSFKRSSTGKYTSTASATASSKPATAAEKEKYKKYYQAKSYKM
jgi:mitogen-activated protein kinase 15